MQRPAEPPLARWLIGLGVVVTLWTVVALPARATYGARTTADEPQYLLTALSLAEDGNLDISDELEARRYEPFHEVTVNTQTVERADGRRISPHDPLLPLLLAPGMRVAGWVGAKITLALLAGLLAVALVWIAVRRLGVAPIPGVVVVGAFAMTPPLVAYGTQVYPELPAALAVTVAVGALLGPLGRRATALVVVASVALPWLSVKYVPVAAVLVAALAVRLGRDRRWSELWAALGVLLGAAVVYGWAHQVIYDGWTAYASGDHFVDGETGVVGFAPDYLGRSRRLAGLLVDDDFGLVAWAPAYLLAVPALGALARVRPRGWSLLFAVLGVGWLTATFVALTMHGWWWPGRQVVAVLPCAVLAVAWWADRVRPVLVAVALAAVASLVVWTWLLVEVFAGSRTLVVDFMQGGGPLSRAWRAVLPAGATPTGTDDLLFAVWVVALAGLAVVGWRSVRPSVGQEPPARRPRSPVPSVSPR